jgi:hypothetical protein
LKTPAFLLLAYPVPLSKWVLVPRQPLVLLRHAHQRQ